MYGKHLYKFLGLLDVCIVLAFKCRLMISASIIVLSLNEYVSHDINMLNKNTLSVKN